MKFFKQTEIVRPLYVARLENGVVLNVFDGYAIGSDGLTYYHVGKENGDILETLGWSSEIGSPVVLNREDLSR